MIAVSHFDKSASFPEIYNSICAEYSANRDYTDYEKFGSILFCNASFNSRIESANYSAQMEVYLSGKEADLSKWNTAIKDYENEKSKCKDVYPLVKQK